MAANGLVWTSDTLTPGLRMAPEKFHLRMAAVMEYEANEAQDYMRINAPWTDRTGNARQGLFGRAFRDAKRHVIVLYHTMPYGIWLEVKQSGQYAIIVPSLPIVGRNVMQSLNGLLRKL